MPGKMVETVTGAVSVEKLGRCLMHEHIIWGTPGYWIDSNGWSKEEIIQQAVSKLEALKSFGVKTVVDATPADCGRNPEMLKEISERAGINIICVGGCYKQSGGCADYFKFRMAYGNAPEEAYQILKHEVTEGIGNSGIKPGLLKVATGSEDSITDYDNLWLEACARVSVECGIKIITHTDEGKHGSEQARRLIALGVKPEHIMIGHLNECMDIKELIDIMELGVYGGYDRMGLQYIINCPAQKYQLAGMSALVGMGYEDKLIMSHDSIFARLSRPWT